MTASCKWLPKGALRKHGLLQGASPMTAGLSLPGAPRNPHSRQHQGVRREATGLGVLLVVEHGQRPQDIGQASPRDEYCRQRPEAWGQGLVATASSHSGWPLPAGGGFAASAGEGLWRGPQKGPPACLQNQQWRVTSSCFQPL